MSHYPFFAFLSLAIILTIGVFVIKVRNKRRLLLFGAWVLFIPLFLPRQWWGPQDATQMLKGKKISKIYLLPSTPDWEVNLTDSPVVISDTSIINQLLEYFRKTEVYFPGHPMRIWETKLIFITNGNDSISFDIQRTKNNGTDIYATNDEWRKDEIGPYLEKIVNYHHPQRAKRTYTYLRLGS
jgi:hypothetical protein